MQKHWLGLLLLTLIFWGCSKKGCGKDTDCKGERVCESGVCVQPNSAEKARLSEAQQAKSEPALPSETGVLTAPPASRPPGAAKPKGITGTITATVGRAGALVSKAPTSAPVRPKPATTLTLDQSPRLGPVDAPVKLVQFMDYQCPFSQRLHPILERVLRLFKGKVSIHYKHFPQSHHKDAELASMAAVCAHEQGKFLAFHSRLFKPGQPLTSKGVLRVAKKLRIKMARFKKCLAAPSTRQLVKQDVSAAEGLGIKGTPFVYINERPFMPSTGYNDKSFTAAIRKLLSRGR